MRVVAHNGAQIWGGAERATAALLDGLARRGHDVTLLCNAAIVAGHASTMGLDVRMRQIGGDIAIHDAFRLAAELRVLRPDAFIVGTFKKLFLAGAGARLAKVPMVVARIGLETDTPRSAKYVYALRHWTDRVAVNSSKMAAGFTNLAGFDAGNVAVIWNGVRHTVPDLHEGAIRDELGIPSHAFVVGTTARLASQKRLDRLLEAVTLLPEIHCIIAGDGPLKAELSSMAASLGIRARVHLLGHREDTASVLHALNVFVVSSDTEGLSNSMLEAMARGLPVVSTDVSGARDALEATHELPAAGIIVEFTSNSIANAIKTIRNEPLKAEQLGEAARLRATTQFSFDSMLDKWEALLSGKPRV